MECKVDLLNLCRPFKLVVCDYLSLVFIKNLSQNMECWHHSDVNILYL